MKILKYIIAIIVIAAIVYGIYFAMNKKKIYAKEIAKFTGNSFTTYLSMDEGYLKNRAAAIKKQAATFTFNGGNYSTATGKAV